MPIQTGPIRFRIESASAGLRRAVDHLESRWPSRHADPSDVPIRLQPRLRLHESPESLPPERPFLRVGDPASGAWRMGQDPLWIAEGDGLESVSVTLATLGSQALAEYGLSQFFRHFVTEALLSLGGLVVHAAAVARPTGAYVFLAAAGGGKTTLVRQHAQGNALSDDMTLVVPGRLGPWIVPSPFPGREGMPAPGAAAPLAALVDLVKDPTPTRVRLSNAESLSCLVRRARIPDHARSVRERVMDASMRLARDPGVTRLGLPLDRPPWPILDAP